MITVTVPLAERSYPVLVGHGARHELAAMLPPSARRAAVVTQAGIPLTVDPGIDHEVLQIPAGEDHKTLATVQALAHHFARMGLTRNDVVVGVGGGLVTDVAGFAAATWHRGVSVVHVATSLVAMVDAAIGGKTGVNLAERGVDDAGRPLVGGKNLIGAYWQPSGVICDLDALSTLPPRERRCGLGEMAKYHFLTGDDLLALGEAERVARCVQIKADVVAGDEREGTSQTRGRALLNYGHTLGHALEIATDHRLAHGEAVAIGLVYAAHLAHQLGRVPAARVDEHYRVVAGAYELDTALPAGLDPRQLVALMGRDKKAVDGGLTFVLDGAEGVEVVRNVPVEAVHSALAAMRRHDS